jgi:hypothetical protein
MSNFRSIFMPWTAKEVASSVVSLRQLQELFQGTVLVQYFILTRYFKSDNVFDKM